MLSDRFGTIVVGACALMLIATACSTDEDSGVSPDAAAGTAGGGGVDAGGKGGKDGGGGGASGIGGVGGGSAGTGPKGGSGGSLAGGSAGTGASAGTSGTGGTGGTPSGGAAGSGGDAGSGGSSGGGSPGSIPGNGTILFQENFDDSNFASREWYDAPSGAINTAEHVQGSASSLECRFTPGATSCEGGTPRRRKFPASQSVYMSFHIKFGPNWIGSGQAYHPHMFHFLTDADGDYVGYANTHLTTYTEVVWDGASGEGRALLALQDTLNVDTGCILRNDDSILGCNGDFSSYAFGENRSVCSCNGLLGDLDGRDCFDIGGGQWYSARMWDEAGAFTDAAGPRFKGDWHFVEAYFEMNSIQNGIGVPDGKIRWVQDGQVLLSYDHILLRTGQHPAMAFVQFGFSGYIGDGSPVDQSYWIDDLTVATARP